MGAECQRGRFHEPACVFDIFITFHHLHSSYQSVFGGQNKVKGNVKRLSPIFVPFVYAVVHMLHHKTSASNTVIIT